MTCCERIKLLMKRFIIKKGCLHYYDFFNSIINPIIRTSVIENIHSLCILMSRLPPKKLLRNKY